MDGSVTGLLGGCVVIPLQITLQDMALSKALFLGTLVFASSALVPYEPLRRFLQRVVPGRDVKRGKVVCMFCLLVPWIWTLNPGPLRGH